jgi:uncharacterized membrane protein
MNVLDLIIYFVIYSFIGWVIETTCIFIETKKIVNRGYLILPILPIFGFGALFILFANNNTHDMFVVFLKSFFWCGILEYVTSYILEKIFNIRLWDYMDHKYNINGRVCLLNLFLFGILGVILIYCVHPIIANLVTKTPLLLKSIVVIILFILLLIDFCISTVVVTKVSLKVKKIKKDQTHVLKQEMYKWLQEHNILYRRIKKSYPKIRFDYKEINKQIKSTIKGMLD